MANVVSGIAEDIAGASKSQEKPNKYVEAVVQLTRLTEEGKVTWRRVDYPHPKEPAPGTTPAVLKLYHFMHTSFLAKYKGRNYLLSRVSRIRNTQGAGIAIGNPFLDSPLVNMLTASHEDNLEIVDEKMNSLGSFPGVAALRGLYAAVQRRVPPSDLDAAVQDLLEG